MMRLYLYDVYSLQKIWYFAWVWLIMFHNWHFIYNETSRCIIGIYSFLYISWLFLFISHWNELLECSCIRNMVQWSPIELLCYNFTWITYFTYLHNLQVSIENNLYWHDKVLMMKKKTTNFLNCYFPLYSVWCN